MITIPLWYAALAGAALFLLGWVAHLTATYRAINDRLDLAPVGIQEDTAVVPVSWPRPMSPRTSDLITHPADEATQVEPVLAYASHGTWNPVGDPPRIRPAAYLDEDPARRPMASDHEALWAALETRYWSAATATPNPVDREPQEWALQWTATDRVLVALVLVMEAVGRGLYLADRVASHRRFDGLFARLARVGPPRWRPTPAGRHRAEDPAEATEPAEEAEPVDSPAWTVGTDQLRAFVAGGQDHLDFERGVAVVLANVGRMGGAR